MTALRTLPLALLLASPSPAATLTRAPYVQPVTPDSAVIAWRTGELVDSVVDYSPDESYGHSASAATPATVHAVSITALNSATSYRLRIRSGVEVLAEGKT